MVFSKTRHIVLTFFFLFIFSVPIYWLIIGKQPSTNAIVERRTLVNFPTLSFQSFNLAMKILVLGEPTKADRVFFNQFNEEKFQKESEDAATDQFPFRMVGIQLTRAVERAQIALAYLPLPDAAIPADMDSLYVLRDGSLLLSKPEEITSADMATLDNHLKNFNELVSSNPEINFYAFFIERVEWANYHPLSKYFPNTDQGQRLEYFEKNKPADLTFEKITFTDLEDYKKFNYHTDHHWNVYGAMRGYDYIYQMLAKNYPDITPPLQHDNIKKFQDIKFLGSLARESLNPVKPDDFEVPLLNLPPYKSYINGKELLFENSQRYLDGNYPNSKYENHYGYYGGNKALLETVFDNGKSRNLLIIGDSYKNPLHLMLASHYHHTYNVDLREYKDFDFSEFFSNHTVNDVIFIGNPNVLFGNGLWVIKP